ALLGPRESRISERGYSDESQGACFRRDNRETDDDPRDIPGSEEVVLHAPMRPAEQRAEHDDADEIKQQQHVIDHGKPGHDLPLSTKCTDWLCCFDPPAAGNRCSAT